MTADINSSTTAAAVVTLLADFIDIDADGSKRLNYVGMNTWLKRQFGLISTATRYTAPRTKAGDADAIVQQLRAAIDRENWTEHPNYPGTVSVKGDVRLRLVEVRDKMAQEAAAIEAPYKEYRAALVTRARALFNTLVVPTFPAGTENEEKTRVYVETFVTDRGEESQPSAASALLTMGDADSAEVTCSVPPVGRNVTARRLYRSASGTTSSAFKLQGEYLIAQTVITDTKLDKELNEVCATFGWLEPPAGLKGLTGLPNGVMLGYVDRTLYACEPYHPYAYPAKYDKPLAHQITGIVAVGQSAFVGTTGRPYLVTGSDSNSLTEELISSKVPCVSARSMVAIGNSVFYASQDGIALYENGRVVIVTKGIIDRKAWQLYAPASMRAAEYDGMYKVFYTKSGGAKGALVFDYENRTITELDQAADAVFSDDDGIYVINGSNVYDIMPAAGANRVGYWNSKTFRLARPQAFAWLHVDSTFLNGATPVSATVRIYAEDVLHETVTVSTSKPKRIKPGRATDWRIEIECAAIINGVVLASTTDELKAVL
jgi:hypothetical protein